MINMRSFYVETKVKAGTGISLSEEIRRANVTVIAEETRGLARVTRGVTTLGLNV
jgi:hypothetical protein